MQKIAHLVHKPEKGNIFENIENTTQGRHCDTLPNSQENLENEEESREKFSFKDCRERVREEYPRAFFPLNV